MNGSMNINTLLIDKLIDRKKAFSISGTKSPNAKLTRTIAIS